MDAKEQNPTCTKPMLCEVITEEQYLQALLIVSKYKEQINKQVDNVIFSLNKETKIEHAGFSTAVYNAFKRESLKNLDDVSKLTKKDILRFRYVGKKGLNNVIYVLDQAGLSLRGL